MPKQGRQAALVALLLGGLAIVAPTFLSGTTRLGGYGTLSGYGGMMGGHGAMMGGYGGMGGFGTGWSVFGILSQLGFLLLLVGGGYLLYRALVADEDANYLGTSDTAMEELRLAYARGDLSDDEYETRRKRLKQSGAS